jgi:S-methylmethionine-dependent homocysteine/selenocysteine methylase
MAKYHADLPQLSGDPFLTDGGLETTLVFLKGVELPCFAAFPLLRNEAGRKHLREYFLPYLRNAREKGVGFVLDTPTWRANPDWAAKLGYDVPALAAANREAVAFAAALRDEFEGPRTRVVVNGVVGPRGDGYRPVSLMKAEEAERYHRAQIAVFAAAGADMVSAITMNYAEEAVGIARAARACGVPSVVSFTVETDGRLATGQTLAEAIGQVDRETAAAPAYYMINCAHPTHFEREIASGGAWLGRVRGVRANASAKSHAELDAATELDSGDPADLARRYRAFGAQIRGLSVFGGCCGTDHRHVAAICEACIPPAKTA